MERGLLWLPLLILFIYLAWAGWNEFRKVETYQAWAEGFRSSKYDIYAVMGLDEHSLVIGKPSRKGPIELQQLSLAQIQSVALRVDDRGVSLAEAEALSNPASPTPKAIALELDLGGDKLQVPFTQLDLAMDWTKRLKQELIQGDA